MTDRTASDSHTTRHAKRNAVSPAETGEAAKAQTGQLGQTGQAAKASSAANAAGAAWLAGAELRPTKQRVLLARLLVGDGQHRHVTAESLYDAVRQSGERVALATVYNTLKAFSDAGLLREITVNGARSYFDTDTSNHAHFYWEDSGELADATLETSDDAVTVTNLPSPPDGAEISKIDVVIRLKRV